MTLRFRALLTLTLLLISGGAVLSEILELVAGFTFIPYGLLCQALWALPCSPVPHPFFREMFGLPLPFLFMAVHLFLLALFPWGHLLPGRTAPGDVPSRWGFRVSAALALFAYLALLASQWIFSRSVGTYSILNGASLLPVFALAWWDLDRGSFRRSLRQARAPEYLFRPLLSLFLVSVALLLSTGIYWQKRAAELSTTPGPTLTQRLATWHQTPPKKLPLPDQGLMELAMQVRDISSNRTVPHLVEFVDFECPPCLEGLPALISLPPDLKQSMRVTLVHFPLCRQCNPAIPQSPHPFACDLALTALAATARGEGLSFVSHRAKYPNQKPQGVLKNRGDWEGQRTTLKAHIASGNAAGIVSTPALFLDGRPLALPKDPRAAHTLLRMILLEQAPPPRVLGEYEGLNHLPLFIFGNPQAAVDVVEFSSFECPFSKEMNRALKGLMEKRAVALVMKSVPLQDQNAYEFVGRYHLALGQLAQTDPDPGARRKWAAAARHARDYQYQLAGMNVGDIQKRLEATARDQGLNLPALKNAFNSETNKVLFGKNMEDARRVDLKQTPTVYMAGELYQGPLTAESLEKFLDKVSKQGQPKP